MNWNRMLGVAIASLVLPVAAANAQIRITEWMYDGDGGAQGGREFIELTNIGNSPVDMTDWSFDDLDGVPGSFSLSGFGSVAAGESVIIAESTAANFRTVWSLPSSVKVLGGNTHNLGRGDMINIFDDGDLLVDSLFYDDSADPTNLIRTQRISGNPDSFAVLGLDDQYQWKFSASSDEFGSYLSTTGNLGNPGFYPAVPEPASFGLIAIGCSIAALRRRRA